MKSVKLKDLIKEWDQKPPKENRWSKKFGGDSGLTEFEQRGGKEINEDNFDKITIPANVKRWMQRFIDSMNSVKLERQKKIAILYKVVKALGLNPQELNVYVQRIRRGLK